MIIESKISEYYELFRGLPNNKPIVRHNQRDDAFVLLVYDLLFKKEKYGKDLELSDLEELQNFIVPPPDDAIDIFFEDDFGDEPTYKIVQVKNTELSPRDIKDCFAQMKRTIESFLKNSEFVNKNLREIIFDTEFDKDSKSKCKYYVVHKGSLDGLEDLNENEKVINGSHLELLFKSIVEYCVPFEELKVDKKSNYLHFVSESQNNDNVSAYQLNINAYDLAKLCNKYTKSEVGRNILFGQNIRESLGKGSRTLDGMLETIKNEPTNFWHYNNGITIVAETINLKQVDDIEILELNKFSIINGAQTTSAFAAYFNRAKKKENGYNIENLIKTYVPARVVETKDNRELARKITQFNNTQNPISSRDMVANNEEQIEMQRLLLKREPKIFVQIRRGEQKPAFIQFQKHRVIENVELAQLLFAGVLANPFTAKDKKNSLFNRDNSNNEYLLNYDYARIFNNNEENSKGQIFRLEQEEIDELLFIRFLHNKAKKKLKDEYTRLIDSFQGQQHHNNDGIHDKHKTQNIAQLKKFKQINNVNTFYNLALYYYLRNSSGIDKDTIARQFDYKRFYSNDSEYTENLITEFCNNFSRQTIDIIYSLGGDDPAKFVRAKQSEERFFDELRTRMYGVGMLGKKCADFHRKYRS